MVISVFTSARFTEGNIIFNQVSETVDKQAIPIQPGWMNECSTKIQEGFVKIGRHCCRDQNEIGNKINKLTRCQLQSIKQIRLDLINVFLFFYVQEINQVHCGVFRTQAFQDIICNIHKQVLCILQMLYTRSL